ncbi:MAG: isopeptide-forming domain-containing fimbrial protein [Coriobacteriia bacterium]|nr:isopeptide-forming domain-containing fimbrial protein [Coriobacteriia bacterium]
MTNRPTTRLKQVAGAFALVCVAFALSISVNPFISPAWAATGTISVVPDDSFAPDGFSWHFEFTGVQSERGFTKSNNISQYYNNLFQDHLVKSTDAGFAAFIYDNTYTDTNGNYRFALRYTGASYTDDRGQTTNVDAIVSLTHWTYHEWPGGRSSDPFMVAFPAENPKPGVFVNNNYSPNATERNMTTLDILSNMNFFTVWLDDLSVNIQYVYAGTNTPVAIKGHACCIDLDCDQAFAFTGDVASAEVSASSQQVYDAATGLRWLEIDPSGKKVYGYGDIEPDDSDSNYQKGLVEVYFDTSASAQASFTVDFETSLKNGPPNEWTPVSFFALSSEYLANPSMYSLDLTKAESTETAQVGEQFDYTLTTALPKEGVDVRMGYRLTSFEITDPLAAQLRYVTAIVSVGGTRLPTNYYTTSITDGTLTCALSASYLSTLQLNGQEVVVTITAELRSMPPAGFDGRRIVENQGFLTVTPAADTDPIPSNVVELQVDEGLSSIQVTKKVSASGVYWDNGQPSFPITLEGTSYNGVGIRRAALLSITPNTPQDASGYYYVSTVFDNVPYGTYTVREATSVRYKLQQLTCAGQVIGDVAHVIVDDATPAWVQFINRVKNYEDGSDSVAAVNHISAG